MRYDDWNRLRSDTERVMNDVAANQSQESLNEQLGDLHVLAMRFGLYDAADYLSDQMIHRKQVERDYGELPSHIHMEAIA